MPEESHNASQEEDNREFYLRAVKIVVDRFEQLLGKKVAMKYARKAPLEISPDGEITGYYGEGRKALEILGEQYEEAWGEEVAYRKIRRSFGKEMDESEIDLLPDSMAPREKEGGILSRLIG